MTPTPKSARYPPISSSPGTIPAPAHATSRWLRVPASEPSQGRTAWRAEGVPLKPYRELSQRQLRPIETRLLAKLVSLGMSEPVSREQSSRSDAPAAARTKRDHREPENWPGPSG
jgi:hypothetical protein